jgi:peptide/nickel transport system ATP-binding protein
MLITHDMGVIAEAADRVAVMYAGRVVETGPTSQMMAAPAHPYSRGLIGCIPSMHRQTDELPQIAGSMPRPGAVPPGCSFHPRCPERLPRCAADRPGTYPARGTAASCWLVAQSPC